MSAIQLEQPVLDGIRWTNFFNGRLLSAEDLSADQLADRNARRLLGQAIGEGVAFGLEVSVVAGTSPGVDPVVAIEAGVAINRQGQALALNSPAQLALVRPSPAAGTSGSAAFSECTPPVSGTYIAGEGVYLLVMSPASFSDGRAPASGLGNISATCTTRSRVDTVQFRLIEMTSADASDLVKARNRIAYQCFGYPGAASFFQDPLNASGARGLIDGMRPTFLTPCDVPLAVILWTATNGLVFVDNWAARRRPARRAVTDILPPLTGDRRLSEGEAMVLQFEDQIRTIRASESNLGAISAVDRFDFLPPLGLIPVLGAGSPAGFDTNTFFGALASRDIAPLDAGGLRSLAHDAIYQEPIPVGASGKIQLYQLWDNVQAVASGASRQLVVVFASPALSYRGIARFGRAQWNVSRFAPRVI